VHFLGLEKDDFAERQFDLTVQIGKPLIVASRNRAEVRNGPAGLPLPIFLDQGNPTIAIANALDAVLGRGRRDERTSASGLGKTGLYLVFKPDTDHTLGLRLRQLIVNRGPFEILAQNTVAMLLSRSRAWVENSDREPPTTRARSHSLVELQMQRPNFCRPM
jgi:hypothetical protein